MLIGARREPWRGAAIPYRIGSSTCTAWLRHVMGFRCLRRFHLFSTNLPQGVLPWRLARGLLAAMKFSSPVYSQASGSIAGLTYSRNRGGNYTRARVTPSNPQTAAQMVARGATSAVSTAWSGLTGDQRNAWELYAASVPLVDRLGAQIQVSGINMFVRSNVPRVVAGLGVVSDGPVDLTLGETPTLDTPLVDVSTQLASCNANVTGGGAGDFALLSITRPVSPSRTPAHEPTHYIGADEYAAGVIALSFDCFFPYGLGMGFRLWVRNSFGDGRLSPWAYLDGEATA